MHALQSPGRRGRWLAAVSLAGAVVCCLGAAAAEDSVVVVLKNGTKLEGVVVEELFKSLVLRTPDGKTQEISFDTIDRIEEAKPDQPGDDPAPQPAEGGAEPEPGKEPPPAAPPAAPPAGEPPAPTAEKAQQGSSTSSLKKGVAIPEFRPQDCYFCLGHGKRTCWLCAGNAKFTAWELAFDCHLCAGRGKVPCEACKATGDTPDPAKKFQCPGCWFPAPHSIAPGLWGCPSCGGTAKFWIENEPKPRKCGVCSGASGFACALCSGRLEIARLAAPQSKRDREKWVAECTRGLEIVGTLAFDGTPLTPDQVRLHARTFPGLEGVARNLEALLEKAQALNNQNIQGSEECAAFFKKAAGNSLAALVKIEKSLLEAEKSLGGAAEPGK